MVKVRTSQIPEDSPIVKIKKQNPKKERDDFDNLLDTFEPDDEEKKVYFRTLINIPEAGSINAGYIHSVEKVFRLRESSSNFEGESVPEYGIVINQGITPGINSPKPDIEIWYRTEEYRNQRYDKLMSILDEVGIKVITL